MDDPNITLSPKSDVIPPTGFKFIYGLGQTKMTHSLTTIGRHLECAIQAELVVESDIPLIRKQSCRFQCNSVICQKDTKGFP